MTSEPDALSSRPEAVPQATEPPRAAVPTSPPTQDRAPQTPDAAAREERAWSTEFGVGMLYGMTAKGEESVAHGPGLSLELIRVDSELDFGFRVHGQYRLPHEASSDRIRLSLQEAVTAGSVTAQIQLRRPIRWRAELGGGAQFVHFEPQAMDDNLTPRDPGWDTRPFLLVGRGLAWRMRDLWVRAIARVDVQLSRTRYEVMDQGEAQPELSVQRIQPGAFFELGGAPVRF